MEPVFAVSSSRFIKRDKIPESVFNPRIVKQRHFSQ